MIAADVDLSRPWLNAGVLVLSLNRLRALNFTATTLEVVKRFRLHDEQAINIYSRGDFTALPRVWNLMPYADWNDGAKLLHWAGAGQKPWDSSDVRFSELWRRYGGAPKNAHSSTSKGYWSDIANYDFAWDARAKRAAALVAPGSRVLDLGCGRMALRRYLPNRCAYVPADLERWNEEVVAVDLDAGEFPAFDCDVIVMLGVLEHLSDPIAVLKRARAHTKTSIVSYRHPGSESLPESRCARRCVNSFSQNEFAALIARSGWAVRSRQTHDRTNLGLEIIYVLVPNDG
jgi:hypothetical protein